MATYDNKNWLLRNIRSSFMSADVTGACEEILSSENIAKSCYENAVSRRVNGSTGDKIITEFDPYPNLDDSDEELPLTPGMFRFDKANINGKDEDNNKRERTVEWQNPKTMTSEELEQLFPRKELRSVTQRKKSVFTETLLEEAEKPAQLTYANYTKFDGTANYGHHTFSFKVFVLLLDYESQQNALNVCVIDSATFEDLIGLVCHKISIVYPNINLDLIDSYALSIADDDGEIIWEFSHLDPKEKCSANYGPTLCLVKRNSKGKLSTRDFMDSNSSMSSVFETDVNWNTGTQDLPPHGMAFVEVPLVKTFQITLQKKNRNISVNLSISDNQIHFVSCQNKMIWGNIKPKTHDISEIISCEIVASKKDCKLLLKFWKTTNNKERGIENKYILICNKFKGKEIIDCINKAIAYRDQDKTNSTFSLI